MASPYAGLSARKPAPAGGTGRHICPPVPGGACRLANLGDADLTDLSTYIQTLPPVTNGPFRCTDGGTSYAPDGFLPPPPDLGNVDQL